MNHVQLAPQIESQECAKGWDKIEDAIEDFEQQMSEAVDEEHEGKRKAELTWKIHRIHWEKNRFIYDLMYVRKAISRQLVRCCADFTVHNWTARLFCVLHKHRVHLCAQHCRLLFLCCHASRQCSPLRDARARRHSNQGHATAHHAASTQVQLGLIKVSATCHTSATMSTPPLLQSSCLCFFCLAV